MSTTRERYLQWKNRCLLPQLPFEIWSYIFSYLEFNDLLSLRLVSRLFYSCINQNKYFWSLVIFDIDQCRIYSMETRFFQNITTSNIDLLTKSNLYSHCKIYLKPQPLENSLKKRRKRRHLLTLENNEQEKESKKYLRCLSIHFQSLRSFNQLQLEYLLKKSVRRLEFSYECLSNEPSLSFLFKLERLKYLKISFLHNIFELNTFALMLINTIYDIINLLLKLKRYRRQRTFLSFFLFSAAQRIIGI